MKLKKKKVREMEKNKANPNESLKSSLISQNYNLRNPKSKLNQEAQFPTNLMLKNKTEKNINLKILTK
jgi:hypothetical protein